MLNRACGRRPSAPSASRTALSSSQQSSTFRHPGAFPVPRRFASQPSRLSLLLRPPKALPVPTPEKLQSLTAEELYKLGSIWTAPPVKSMKPNKKVAAQVWQFAIDKFDHAPAKFSLGSLLLHLSAKSSPSGASQVNQTDAEALIQSGDSSAGDSIGVRDQESMGQGLRLLTEAAAAGHAWAAANLALVHSRGIPSIGLTANVAKAVELYQQAWTLGKVPHAPFNIYALLQTSQPASAFQWLRLSADEAKDSSAQYQMACIIRDGKVPKDLHSAEITVPGVNLSQDLHSPAYYFKKLADNKSALGQYNLAHCFLDGKYGAPKDPRLALRYFAEASAQGFVPATLNTGIMFAEGQGLISPDPNSAQIYFKEVETSQHEGAKTQLRAYYAQMFEKEMEAEDKLRAAQPK